MKRQSAAGLFLSMFLRATVIILGIGIIIFGIVFLTQVIKGDDGKQDKGLVTTVDENVLQDPGVRDDLLENSTEATEATEEAEPVAAYDKMIAVLNSTTTGGLAGRWCEKLNGYGYENTYASDFSNTQETTIIVVKENGVGEELTGYFNDPTYMVGEVPEGAYENLDGYDVVIILGTKDSDQ